jgi:hypothetical protein
MYGKHKKFSTVEIKTSILRAGFDHSFIEYAYAMFMSRDQFNKVSKIKADIDTYDALRTEIAKTFFSGNAASTIHDMIAAASANKK